MTPSERRHAELPRDPEALDDDFFDCEETRARFPPVGSELYLVDELFEVVPAFFIISEHIKAGTAR